MNWIFNPILIMMVCWLLTVSASFVFGQVHNLLDRSWFSSLKFPYSLASKSYFSRILKYSLVLSFDAFSITLTKYCCFSKSRLATILQLHIARMGESWWLNGLCWEFWELKCNIIWMGITSLSTLMKCF